MKSIGRTIVLGLVAFLPISCLYGQRRKASPEEQLAQARASYGSYRFAEAIDFLDKISLGKRGQSSSLEAEVTALKAKAERAQRMLANAEEVRLIDSMHIAPSELDELIGRLGGGLRRSLSVSSASTPVSGTYISADWGRKLFSLEVDGNREIFHSDLIAQGVEQASEGMPLGAPINTPEDEISPFVLPDGEHLIFARASKDGLGGYDLYWSRYNADRQVYYEPRLLGMPFNSTGNDYLLVYDDETNEGLLVSDRFCPADSLVVYRFEGLPKALSNSSFAGENQEDVGDERGEQIDLLRRRALFQIDRVGKSGVSQTDALQEAIYLPLRGGVAIRSWSDFRNAQALALYREYLSSEHRLQELEHQLRLTTADYVQARSLGEVYEQASAISELKRDVEALRQRQTRLLKEVKNAEISERGIESY